MQRKMVDGRERNDLYDLYEDVIAEMGFPVLSTRLPDSKKFRRNLSEERKSVFRSTIFPIDASLQKGSGIREFSEEIAGIIKPQGVWAAGKQTPKASTRTC